MKAVKWQRAVSLFLCLLMAMSFFVVTAPNAYADEGDTTGVTWPQLKEKGGLTFKDDNGDNKLVSNAYNYSTNNEGFTFTSKDVTISNYTELVSGVPRQKETATKRVYQVGEIVLNYGDALLAAPTSNFSLNPRNNCVFKAVKDADNSVINALNGAATLNSGEYYMRVFVVTDKENPTLKYHYYYHLKIVGSNLLAHYPDTWTADEIGPNFEFSSAEYIDSYTSWGLTSQIIPTWGTTLSKDKLDFTNGHDTFTLTNLAGKSQEYTVTLKMPWQFKIPPLPGYNVAVLSAGNVPLCENQTLTTPSDRIDEEIKSGQWVTMSVKPTGENKNMVIKTVTLTKSRDNETIPAKDIKISGNTFTFKMPDDCVTVTAITFKEDPSPSYDISASATKYRNEIGYAMSKHLNPLEKEFLIRQYKSNYRIKMSDFCEANHISTGAFQKWIKQYDEGGLEGLARADSEIKDVLPEGIDRTEESYKREILKLRIENERLKKTMSCRRRILGNRSSFV